MVIHLVAAKISLSDSIPSQFSKSGFLGRAHSPYRYLSDALSGIKMTESRRADKRRERGVG
jgi:hypothetical protein